MKREAVASDAKATLCGAYGCVVWCTGWSSRTLQLDLSADVASPRKDCCHAMVTRRNWRGAALYRCVGRRMRLTCVLLGLERDEDAGGCFSVEDRSRNTVASSGVLNIEGGRCKVGVVPPANQTHRL